MKCLHAIRICRSMSIFSSSIILTLIHLCTQSDASLVFFISNNFIFNLIIKKCSCFLKCSFWEVTECLSDLFQACAQIAPTRRRHLGLQKPGTCPRSDIITTCQCDPAFNQCNSDRECPGGKMLSSEITNRTGAWEKYFRRFPIKDYKKIKIST